MTVDQIDWLKLKPYKHDKRKSFEQLCYQVALALFSDQGTFTPIDDSGGGSGVEFYLETPDGSIRGWQAKYYPGPNQRLTASRRQHIKESLTVTKRRYGERLKRWYLCTPIDFEVKGERSELQWFEKKLKREAGHVELVHWGDSDLIAFLRNPKLNGIVQFFFGEFQPTLEWFNTQVSRQIANLGDKYIPELHTATGTDFELHALLGDSEFSVAANNAVRELAKGIKEVKLGVRNIRSASDPQFANQIASVTELLEKVTSWLDAGLLEAQQFALAPLAWKAFPTISSAIGGAIDNLREYFELVRKHTDPIDAVARTLSREPEQNPDKRRICTLQDTIRKAGVPLDGILSRLIWLRKYVEIREKRVLHLLGGAGSGKTHVLAKLCSTKTVSGIFLRGTSFSRTGTIQAQILQELDLHIPWSEFIGSVDAYARANQVQALLAIDAMNEAGDIGLWQQELAGFERDLRDYPNVVFVTSCRSSYSKALWNNADTGGPPFSGVWGFHESELKTAVKKYFDYFRISATVTLETLKAFSHPLYLRIFCEAENRPRKDVKQIFLGQQSLFDVFEKYLDAANASFSVRVNRATEAKLLQSLLRKFARHLWDQKARHLAFREAVMLFDDVPPDQLDWKTSRTKALLDEELILSRSYLEGGEVFEFTYDLLAGYLVGGEALASLSNNLADLGREQAVKAISPLFVPLVDDDWRLRHPLHEDVLRSIAAVFPARTGRHLAYIADHPQVLTAAINAWFEMDAKYLGPRESQAVRALFNDPNNRAFLLDRLRNTAFSPTHPFNATFLSGLLSSLPMADRDLFWSEYVRAESGALKETIGEFVEACRGSSPSVEHKGQLRLAAEYLTLVLTSNNRYLRDSATRALMIFGKRFPLALFNMTERSLICNDSYVPERMLAACYGAAMALHCRPGSNRFRDDLLPKFAYRVFAYMFAERAPLATTHCLKRDYARGIIELALHCHPDSMTYSEKNRITPPFKGGLRNWRRRPDYDKDKYRGGNSPLEMDFENDTMGSLVPGRSRYDYKHPGFVEVKEKILWRIHDLGYSLARFGEIDKSIASRHWYRRDDDARTDNYGAKYAWIAFYELYGLREDQGLLKSEWRYGGPHPDDADIDPSFPAPPRRRGVLIDDILGKSEGDPQKWVNTGPSPDFRHYLVRDNHDGEQGPWLLIDAHFGRYSKAVWRTGFAFIRAFFIKDSEFEKARRLLRGDKARSSWLPNVSEARGYFAGEFPWRRDFPYSIPESFQVPVGKRRVPNEDPPIVLRIGNIIIDSATQKRSKWRYEPVNEAFGVESTVQDSAFSGRSAFERPNGTVPSKQLCERFGLWLRLPSWDMYDAAGRRVSITTALGDIANRETTVYMRQQLLEAFLAENSLTLVWIVWGERQRLTPGGMNAAYKQYKQLYSWQNGAVKKL